MHRIDAVGNSLGVRRELTEGIRSLPRRCKEVRQKKTETSEDCRGRCSGISLKFARRFAERIEKLVGNTPGDPHKKTGRLVARMLEATRLKG
ncbi:hypothetical protein BHM03_00037874, partial [Ensete ventricosum]